MDQLLEALLFVFNNFLNNLPVVAAFLAGLAKVGLSIRKKVRETKEFVDAVVDAIQPDADGNVRIEKEEWDKVKKEFGDIF